MLSTAKDCFELKEMAVIMQPASDDVAVAKRAIAAGTILRYAQTTIEVKGDIPAGQRLALRDIPAGELIRQYGYPFAQSKGIKKGELIALGNTANKVPDPDLSVYREPPPTRINDEDARRTFMGYRRKNGCGTRNYYLIIPASMCASETALQAALCLEGSGILGKYPNVDGIVALPHSEGCGCDSGLPIDRLLLVLKGYLRHPNAAGCLLIDLGCEQSNREKLRGYLADTVKQGLKPLDWITIQDSGGTRLAIERAKELVASRLPELNRARREALPISGLILGTECGASDSFSGITANPLIGSVADKVICAGGAAILSEITEMVGTFQMLLPRFRNMATARAFQRIMQWYAGLAQRMGLSLEPNLVPKNIEGGLINNYIKSLGAVIKGGTTVIEDVVDYAQPLRRKGLTIMQGPGNDPESVTGLVAGGANIICFSTGKGTVTGDAICPVIKISSNAETFRKLPEDMDFDASRMLEKGSSPEGLSQELFQLVIDVASGRKTWSEKWKQRQFQVWSAGKLSL